MGKARDVALVRAFLARRKAESQARVQKERQLWQGEVSEGLDQGGKARQEPPIVI